MKKHKQLYPSVTQKHIDSIKSISKFLEDYGKAQFKKSSEEQGPEENEMMYIPKGVQLQGWADSIEALLAEREELLKDKARLDHYEANNRNYRYISDVSMDGKYPAWSYRPPSGGIRDTTLHNTLRAAIDAAMKGDT